MTGPRFSIIPALAVTDTRLDGWALRVLALLGRHTNDQGWCIRSQARMAEELGISRPLVNRCVRDLTTCGYVETVGNGRVLRYRVRHDLSETEVAEAVASANICQPADIKPPPVSPLTSDVSPGVTSDVTLRDTERPLINEIDADAQRGRARNPADVIVAAVNSPFLDPTKSPDLIQTSVEVHRWIAAGADVDLDLIPVVTAVMAKATRPVRKWGYFTEPVREHVARRLAPIHAIQPAPEPAHAQHLGTRHGRPDRPRAFADQLADYAERLATAERAKGLA